MARALKKVFPDHWSFLLGELAMYSLVVLVVTGLFLTLFFDASGSRVVYDGSYEPLRGSEVSRAYRSVVDLSFDVRAGLVMRQTHHWAALVFLAVIALHAARVFFTGAFRRPRRLNWALGVTLLALALANGFFGLSLTDDLLSGTGLRIFYAIALSVPVVGAALVSFLFAGEFPAPGLIPRLWWLHVVILPLLIVGLFAVHLVMVWRQTHAQFAGPREREDNVIGESLWPSYAGRSGALLFAVAALLTLLGGWAEINPVWLYGPFEAASATVPAQPDWYLGWIEGALRIMPPFDLRAFGFEVPSPFFSGFLLPFAVFALLYAWPLLEARLTGDHEVHHLLDRPRDHPVRTATGAVGLAFLGVLLLAGSHDLQGQLIGVPVDTMTWAYRALASVVPPVVGLLTWRICRDLAARGGAMS
ncbi:MAG: cytochrome b N-terminal domain-containing protein [Actinomycetota bacterium]|nr:cytochrome b N-terminal domain-containing protein [Actinomycetota bacterium]